MQNVGFLTARLICFALGAGKLRKSLTRKLKNYFIRIVNIRVRLWSEKILSSLSGLETKNHESPTTSVGCRVPYCSVLYFDKDRER